MQAHTAGDDLPAGRVVEIAGVVVGEGTASSCWASIAATHRSSPGINHPPDRRPKRREIRFNDGARSNRSSRLASATGSPVSPGIFLQRAVHVHELSDQAGYATTPGQSRPPIGSATKADHRRSRGARSPREHLRGPLAGWGFLGDNRHCSLLPSEVGNPYRGADHSILRPRWASATLRPLNTSVTTVLARRVTPGGAR